MAKFASIYAPAVQANDLEPALDWHRHEIVAGCETMFTSALNRIVRYAQLLDVVGDPRHL
jgi:hypothetical protein